jgi:hypothetical protein
MIPSSVVAHERLIDRRALELEVIEVLGERQLGDGELILDRACLLRRLAARVLRRNTKITSTTRTTASISSNATSWVISSSH